MTPAAPGPDLAALLGKLQSIAGLPGFDAERAGVEAQIVAGRLDTIEDAALAAMLILEQLARAEVDDVGGNAIVSLCAWVLRAVDADAESCA